ncbi:MAG: GTPase HflX [Agarilytica sp.]
MFFDRPDSGELAVLVHFDFNHREHSRNQNNDPREFEDLALSAGADPTDFLFGRRNAPDPKYFIGSGKLEELIELVVGHGAELVIFNHDLSPSQERNLEEELQCRVLDRTGLILDIFAQRARTHEGKLQVELAQLQHMSTRLIRGWTHLERQKGGIGLRGPGETQLETDRRLLRGRIKSINKRLDKVRKQREQGRRARTRADVPTVSLVGYTNAGKSTLFNALTDADVYAKDQLFATLDPTMRKVELEGIGQAVLADTVGFISNLPHRLVESFRATLEEATSAELLLHVIDAVDEERARNIEQVNIVLEEIGASDLPQLLIYNKIDLITDYEPRIDRDEQGKPIAVWLSAQSNLGLDLLLQAISELLHEEVLQAEIVLSAEQGSLRARLFRQNAVLEESYNDDGSSVLSVKLPFTDFKRALAAENISIDSLDINEDHPRSRVAS